MLPKIVFEATSDGLVVPGISIQMQVSWGRGCCNESKPVIFYKTLSILWNKTS